MDGSIRTELDAADIIAGIMRQMEEVVDLIQRPGPQAKTPFWLAPPAIEAETPPPQDMV